MENQKLKQDIIVNKLKVKQLEQRLLQNPADNNVRNSLMILKKHLDGLISQQGLVQ